MAADHETLLALSSEQFEQLVLKLDSAFEAGMASLVYSRSSRSRVVSIVGSESTQFDEDAMVEMQELALGLDSLLLFAFQGAPHEVARSWGEEHGVGYGDRAVEFVEVLRAKAPAMRAEWVARSVPLGRELGEMRAPVVFSSDSGGLRALLRLEAFEVSGLRLQPDPGTKQVLEAALSRSDLNRMISVLIEAVSFIEAVGEWEDSDVQ